MRLAEIYVNAYMKCVKQIALLFAALADGSRLRLLRLMKDSEICVCHLQTALRTNQPKISRHLAYLRRAGLVEARREGRWMHYRLKPQRAAINRLLREALDLIEKEPQVQRDAARAGQIQCAPGRYGLSRPR